MDVAADKAETLLKLVAALAEELHPGQMAGRPVKLDSMLDQDLGFDSLGRVELVLRVERAFDVTVPEQTFATMETPRDLLRAVVGAKGAKAATAAPVVEAAALGAADVAPPEADTLVAVLDWHAARHPDRAHLRLYSDEGEGEILTYGELKNEATAVAKGLRRSGLQPGEAVVVMLPTSRAYFATFFGILLAGGVPAPIYPPLRPSQIEDHLRRHARIVENCAARHMVVEDQAKPVARLLQSQVEILRFVTTPAGLAAAGSRGEIDLPLRAARDTALLQYTSGSTGTPKGLVLTHANLLANIRSMSMAMKVGSEDVFVSWLPLYHDMGLIGAWLGSLVNAVHLVIMPPLAFLARPQRWLTAIHRYRGTLSAAPNFAYELCLKRIPDEALKELDLRSWRVACNGAEAVSPQTVERFCTQFAAAGFRREAMMPVYGLAESSVGLAFPPLDRGPLIDRIDRKALTGAGKAIPAAKADATALRFVACGRPIPGHQIRVIDATGRELPERTEGRLQFKGPSATGGYLRNPDKTWELFDGDWLGTGDLAYLAEGDVYITGRTKDIVIHAGRNIYPEELEEAVGDLSGVQKGNVAVFGSTDPETGTERLVVLAETRKRTPRDQATIRSRITDLAVDLVGTPPNDIVLAPPRTVLKTSSGKIRRAASRELYEAGMIGRKRHALWWQVVRLSIAGLLPQTRRSLRALRAVAYAAYAWGLFCLVAPPIWFAVVLAPRAWRWTVLGRSLRLWAWLSGIRLSLRGVENLPSTIHPCVLVSNHASYLDGFVLSAMLPRAVEFVAKAELVRKWPARIPLRRIGAAFIERFDSRKGVEDAKQVAKTATGDQPPLFFAEGTIRREPGLLPFHMGAFVAAAEAHIPVVPLTIRGTRSILRPEGWFPRKGTITVLIGPPIEPGTFESAVGGDTWALALKLRDAARSEILRHCGERDLGYEMTAVADLERPPAATWCPGRRCRPSPVRAGPTGRPARARPWPPRAGRSGRVRQNAPPPPRNVLPDTPAAPRHIPPPGPTPQAAPRRQGRPARTG